MFRRSTPVATHPAHNSFFRIDRPIPPNAAQTRTCTSYRRPRREIECGGRMAGAHRSIGTGVRGPSGHPSASKSSRSDLIESCSGMQQGRPCDLARAGLRLCSISEAHVRGAAARRRYGRRIRSGAFDRSHNALFDDVVSPSQQRHGHIDAECFSGLEVDHQLDLGDLLHRQVGGPFARPA